MEPHYYSHLSAKHLEVAALWECNGDIEYMYMGVARILKRGGSDYT